MPKQTVVIIHGIGEHEKGWSKEFQYHLLKKISPADINFVEICYSQILDMGLKEYTMNENSIKELGCDDFRKLFNMTMFDAISYGYTRKAIYDLIERKVPKDAENVTVIAHSLGGIVAYDWIYHSQENPKNKRIISNFFTLGSPLALKMISRKHELNLKYWLNIVGEYDIIGKPMKISPANMKQVNRDYICPIGSFVQRRTPFCHTAYFEDGNVIKPIVEKLRIDISGKKFNEKAYNNYIDELWKV